jgi:hypothetical protein
MSSSFLNDDFFSVSNETIIKSNTQSDSVFYKPDITKTKDGTYGAVVKPIFYYKDKTRSIIDKWSIYLVNELSGKAMTVDCPSTIGQKSILQDTYFRLKKSENPLEQEAASKFSRKENHFMLVQILRDDQNPHLVGQIKVFKFGAQINKKILAQVKPDPLMDDGSKPNELFDILRGRPLVIKVEKNPGGWPDYNQSYFSPDSRPMLVDGSPLVMTSDEKQNAARLARAKEIIMAAPDLAQHAGYKPWTPETEQHVHECIAIATRSPLPSINNSALNYPKIDQGASRVMSNNPVPAAPSVASASDIDFDSLAQSISQDDDLFSL